jgi:peroxiredoxin
MKQLLTILFLIVGSFSYAQQKPEGLFINSKAPDFKVKDQSGAEINLKDLRKKGPVVLIFYRGNWCPYCNKELTRLQDSLQLITEKGAQVIAITPEASDGINKTIEKTKAVFPIIHDEEMKEQPADIKVLEQTCWKLTSKKSRHGSRYLQYISLIKKVQ